MADGTLWKCKHCSEEIPYSTASCPVCSKSVEESPECENANIGQSGTEPDESSAALLSAASQEESNHSGDLVYGPKETKMPGEDAAAQIESIAEKTEADPPDCKEAKTSGDEGKADAQTESKADPKPKPEDDHPENPIQGTMNLIKKQSHDEPNEDAKNIIAEDAAKPETGEPAEEDAQESTMVDEKKSVTKEGDVNPDIIIDTSPGQNGTDNEASQNDDSGEVNNGTGRPDHEETSLTGSSDAEFEEAKPDMGKPISCEIGRNADTSDPMDGTDTTDSKEKPVGNGSMKPEVEPPKPDKQGSKKQDKEVCLLLGRIVRKPCLHWQSGTAYPDQQIQSVKTNVTHMYFP